MRTSASVRAEQYRSWPRRFPAATTQSKGRQVSRSFKARFGPVIASRGIAPIPGVLLRGLATLQLRKEDLIVLLRILCFYQQAEVWPSAPLWKLAQGSLLTERQTENSLRRLERRGFVNRQEIHPYWRHPIYNLSGLFSRLEELALEEATNTRKGADRAIGNRSTNRGTQTDASTEASLQEQLPDATVSTSTATCSKENKSAAEAAQVAR